MSVDGYNADSFCADDKKMFLPSRKIKQHSAEENTDPHSCSALWDSDATNCETAVCLYPEYRRINSLRSIGNRPLACKSSCLRKPKSLFSLIWLLFQHQMKKKIVVKQLRISWIQDNPHKAFALIQQNEGQCLWPEQGANWRPLGLWMMKFGVPKRQAVCYKYDLRSWNLNCKYQFTAFAQGLAL